MNMANDSSLSTSTTSNLNNGYETAVDNSSLSLYYSINGTLLDDTLSCTTNDDNLNDTETIEIFKNIRPVENLNSLTPILQNDLTQIRAVCSTPAAAAVKYTENNNSVSEDAIDTTNDTIETVIESFNVISNKHQKITLDELAQKQIDDSTRSSKTNNELIMNNSNNFANENKSPIKSNAVLVEQFVLQEQQEQQVNIDKSSDTIVTEQIIDSKTDVLEEHPSSEITECVKKLSSSEQFLKNEVIDPISEFILPTKQEIVNSNKEKSIVKKMNSSLNTNTTNKRLSISTEFRKQSITQKRISVLHTISEDKVSNTNTTSRLQRQSINISKIPEGNNNNVIFLYILIHILYQFM